ncbi:nuclear pore complex protein Nup214 [Calliopsis andreniformis]|uniref:nuclear pore complex protein Nup214 n=1 Tax=Calliopsis andreniformis TaxID=337506 RepID=UPI003FCECC4E
MKTAPDPKDIQEFQFKQSHISQIVNAYTSIPVACNLLVADKKRGLLYVGQNNKILIIKPGEDSDPEWKIEIELSIVVSKLTISCDCSYLAVVPHGPSVLIYDLQSFVTGNLQLLHEIRIPSSNIDTFVSDLQWNPTVPGMLCLIASDHTVGSFQIKEEKEKTIELKALEKLNGLDVLCAAWSPKGKQIVVGCKNGNIVQLKPDLKVARTIPGPTPYIGEVISILWISNYQFCAAYLGSEQRINVLIVDAPKGEVNAIFTCYEDITYGVTDTEAEGMISRYYFDYVPEWGLIIAASSNSSEIAVLGSEDGGTTWSQWQLVDSGRAELPLICTTESYPVGIAIDKSSSRKLPWGADSTLPHPVPMLHILATSGQLCSFHMVNLFPNCPAINCPPTGIISTPPQPQMSVVPAESSIIMNGLITSTPRPKQPETILERPKPPPSGNIFDKFLKGTGLFAQTPIEKPKQQEQKLEVSNANIKLESPKEIHSQESVKVDVKLTPIKETVSQESVEPKPIIEDDSRDIRAYLEEHSLFEKELRDRLEPQSWVECGTEEERRKLIETSAILDQFLRELRETTNSLSSDIAYLKALLLQSFAWVEETKSKNAATNDITSRNCGDNNKISDLQKLYYYTQTQLIQASKILDLEWLDNKSHEMSRMKIPHLEFVYQNLILHNKIIQEEKGKVEQLKKQWKLITRSNNIFGLNRSFSNLSMTSSKSSASFPRNAGIIEARCKAIALKTLSFTQGKQMKLREYLSASTPRIIKPVNPSPVQDRLEATLSSLASLSATTTDTASTNNTLIDAKAKVEQPVSKQTHITKQVTEKPKQQSPLASLNSIVARIGTNETNNMLMQNKTQTKQPVFSNTFQTGTGTKPVQAEKTSSLLITTTTPQSIKSKQDNITFSQVNTSTLPSLMKSFPKVDSISFGTSAQKPEETTQKSGPKETGIKTDKEAVQASNSLKVEPNMFGTTTLNDALSSEILAGKIQGIASNTSLNLTIKTFAAMSSKPAATFNFATSNAVPVTAKSSSQNVRPQTTIAQSFSFASKPASTTTPFNLKLTPTTASQTQEPVNLTGFFTGRNIDEKSNSKVTLKVPGFQTPLGQDTSSINQISIGLGGETPTKETTTTTPSVTIEEIPSAVELKVSNFQSNSAQSLPATSAIPLFATQTSASNVSVFGEMSSPTPTTATFTVTTSSSAFGVQTTCTSPMSIFGGFSTTPATSTTTTFGKLPISPASMPFGSSTNTSIFGNVATTTSAKTSFFSGTDTSSIFGGNTQTSSTGSIFDKYASPTNTFGTPQKSIFDNTQKSGSIFGGTSYTGSFFGGAAANTTSGASSGSTSVFGYVGANIAPMGMEQPVLAAQTAFGQAPSFDNKPVFGSPPAFGASKPIFGGGFGATAFGASPTPPAFGSPPTMGGSPAPIDNNMSKVFGNVGGSTTFESLANQSGGLTFGNLAQKSPEAEKPPVFTSGSSFSSWR